MTIRPDLTALRERVEEEYRRRTPTSRALHAQAQTRLPAGDTRTGTWFAPYPTYVESARGSYVHDVDGNALLDFTNNATALVHGHAHPAIVATIQQQAARGTAWTAPNPLQVELARLLCERVPSLERVRFCNSGTEANMQAIKAARAFTGRDRILKMDRAYHGSYEGVEFNAGSHAPDRSDGALQPIPTVRGIPSNQADNVLVATFDDAEAAARLIAANCADLAAVVVTPVLTRGGLVPPSPGYLASLREATREHDVLLIFDEVISFRVAAGGAQELYGVVPDLTALGKVIGGGLPVGAFGGRAEIMRLFADGDPPGVSHAGTFNGNPLTMAAGLAALELLTPAAYARLAELGGLLRARLAELLRDLELAFRVQGVASLVSLDLPASGQDDRAAAELLRLVQLALLNRGIKASGLFAISTVVTEAEIECLADTLREVLREFRPVIEAEAPQLARRTPQAV